MQRRARVSVRRALVKPDRREYKLALLEAAVKVRKRGASHGHQIPLQDDGWAQLADGGPRRGPTPS